MSGLTWIQTVWHSDSILKEFFENIYFEIDQQTITILYKSESFLTKNMYNYICPFFLLKNTKHEHEILVLIASASSKRAGKPVNTMVLLGHRHEQTCLRGFRQSEIQTSLFS